MPTLDTADDTGTNYYNKMKEEKNIRKYINKYLSRSTPLLL